MQYKALLFDLDGTLIDTAPDMVNTLHIMQAKYQQKKTPYDQAKVQVSNGARALLNLGFSSTILSTKETQLIEEFLSTYAEHVCEQSHLFDGMMAILTHCQSHDIPWGIVTNKPYHLSLKLLQKLGLEESCAILLGGDSLAQKKPHPAPLLHCCMHLHLAASDCLYIGDHSRDILAGNQAGMDTAVALWGYLQNDDDPETWNANFLLKKPQSIMHLLSAP